jgi:hypothetical protein
MHGNAGQPSTPQLQHVIRAFNPWTSATCTTASQAAHPLAQACSPAHLHQYLPWCPPPAATEIDHGYWGRPEDQKGARPAQIHKANCACADLLGQCSAALASTSLVFKANDELPFAKSLLDHATQLYAWASRKENAGGGSDMGRRWGRAAAPLCLLGGVDAQSVPVALSVPTPPARQRPPGLLSRVVICYGLSRLEQHS